MLCQPVFNKSEWHREVDLHVGTKFVSCGNGTANTDHETVWGQSSDSEDACHFCSLRPDSFLTFMLRCFIEDESSVEKIEGIFK